MKTLRLKFFILSFVTVLLVLVLIPVIFMLELSLIPLLQTNLETSIQISFGDAMTMASVMGAVGVFILERYWNARRNEQERLYGSTLRLILKQIRDQIEPKTIAEHWKIFINDVDGRNSYCNGGFSDMSLDKFTAHIYALRMEGQIDITPGHQVIYRVPYEIKVMKLGADDKAKMIELLISLVDENKDELIREDAIRALAEINDLAIVKLMKKYMNDSNPRVQLEAAKAIIKLVSLPES
jgi:hypothetical protein